MTPKQKKLAEIMAASDGKKTKKEMMLEAGYSEKYIRGHTADAMNNPRVTERVTKLARPHIKKLNMDIRRRVEILTDIAEDFDNLPADRMKAIDMLNKMDGVYNKQQDKFRDRELVLKEKEFELKKQLAEKNEEW